MTVRTHTFGDCRLDLLCEEDGTFRGLGRMWIGETQVRSGRLPLAPWFATFSGWQLARLELLGVDAEGEGLRIRLRPHLQPMPIKLMRDHSFDPIHEVGDWDAPAGKPNGRLDLVLQPATDSFNGIAARGFSYGWEIAAESEPLFHLLDRASWELGGDIAGATAVSQSSCSDPLATFDKETAWTTEGVIHWDPDMPNPVMTHNLPRWASHQAFDFQHKEGQALLGVYQRVDLIRSLLRREAGAAELKTFDKHIFDQATRFATSAKAILLVDGIASETQMRNLWSWVFDAVHRRARAEFGLEQEPTLPRLSQNYWHHFYIDSYFKDLLPAAAAIGVRQIFIDNVNKNAMTEAGVGNMCCGHEYEVADRLGGESKLKELVERAREHGIQVASWTNNDQAYTSPINRSERDERGWFVKMEDTRLKYGGAYTNVFTILDFGQEAPRRYWIDCLKHNRQKTGLSGYLFDSFYNLGFMPVNYSDGTPSTMWRGTLTAMKELQEADVHFLIESFGPFGQPQHGCPSSYSIDRCWVCYEISIGNDYTTVPTAAPRYLDPRAENAETLHYTLAHKSLPPLPLFKDDVRIDRRFGAAHRAVFDAYHAVLPHLHTRYLQEDDRAVIWHNAAGDTAIIFAFAEQQTAFTGELTEVGSGDTRRVDGAVTLAAHRTYLLRADTLPTRLDRALAVI